MAEDLARPEAEAQAAVVIKKYANRRLYNTGTSTYVTLDHLADMVRQGRDFVVYDARSNDDITRQVLTQIIFEEETRGENLLPIKFLRQLIGLYGGQMQGVVPSYLEMSLEAFSKQQHVFQEQAAKAMGAVGLPAPTAKLFEEQVRRNMSLFAEAMKVWAPGVAAAVAPAAAPAPPKAEPAGDDLTALREQMAAMQAQLAKLAQKG